MKFLTLFFLFLLTSQSIGEVLMDVPSALKFHFGKYDVTKEKVYLTPTFLKKLVLRIKIRNKNTDKDNFIKFALSPIAKLIKIIEIARTNIIELENF